MQILSVDTETFPFGEQPDGSIVIIPPMVCTTVSERVGRGFENGLCTNGDGGGADMRLLWQNLLGSDALLVFHNAAYDLAVCCITYPELEQAVWKKVKAGEVTCTKIREKLLNLSTHGNLENLKLPDKSKIPLSYSLADLTLKYFGKDRSAEKAEGSVRTMYNLYDGWTADEYPEEAVAYALADSEDTLRVYYHQQDRVKSDGGRYSVTTEGFQVAADLALFLTTAQGMPIDPEQYTKLQEELAIVLSDDNMQPLVDAGILRPFEPSRPHKNKLKKVVARLEGVEEDELVFEKGEDLSLRFDWTILTEEDRAEITAETGCKWTKPKASSIDTTALKERITVLTQKLMRKPKLTATGEICADSEVIDDLVFVDQPEGKHTISPLECYQNRQEVSKLVSTELPRMTWNEKIAERVFFPFNVLVSTGRTSSFASKHFPSGNGQNLDPRARLCYLPEKGCHLVSIDFSTLELCSVGQTLYDLFGRSTHRDLINEGIDLHAYLGAALARALDPEFKGHTDMRENYKLFLLLKISDSAKYDFWRGFAKPVGLGYPGGLGLMTFLSLAKKTYRVNIIDVAMKMAESRLPRWEHSTVKWYGEKMGQSEESWTWNPLLKGIALAALLRDIWFDTFPEMREYFAWIVTQEDSECYETDEEGKTKSLLCYTTPMGMHRTGCIFAAAANGKAMQSPSAEGAKIAVIETVISSRIGALKGRFFLHAFIHDEVIGSVPQDPVEADRVITEVQRILETSMSQVMPDVRISTSAVLMKRWHKYAKPVYNEQGLLVPWEPKPPTP